jgi:hypothetical protein
MRPFILILVAASGFILPAIAADPVTPTVKLAVRKHLLDSDRDKGAKHGEQVMKAYTLRVEVTNTGKTTLAGASLSGTALVHRARAMNDRIVSEPLTSLEVPQLKPNGTVTLDLGRIDLHKLVLRQRQMEETLDEWQVVLTQGEVELAKEQSSSGYEALSKVAIGRPGKGERKKKK